MSSAFDPRQPNRTRQPAPRPAQAGQRRRSRCSVRLSLLSVLLNSPPLVPRSPLAALVLSNRFLPSARRGRPRNHAPTHIMLMARTALLQPRVRAITRTPAVVPKRKAPRCFVVGGVAAVLALVADRFLCRAGR